MLSLLVLLLVGVVMADPITCSSGVPSGYVDVGSAEWERMSGSYHFVASQLMLGDAQDARELDRVLAAAKNALLGAAGTECCYKTDPEISAIRRIDVGNVFCKTYLESEDGPAGEVATGDPLMCSAPMPSGFRNVGSAEFERGSGKYEFFGASLMIGDAQDAREQERVFADAEKALVGRTSDHACCYQSDPAGSALRGIDVGFVFCETHLESESSPTTQQPIVCPAVRPAGWILAGVAKEGTATSFEPREFMLGDSQDARAADEIQTRAERALIGESGTDCCLSAGTKEVHCKSSHFADEQEEEVAGETCDISAEVTDPDPLGLNVRAGPERTAQKVGTVPNGAMVTITKSSGRWVYISDVNTFGEPMTSTFQPGWVYGGLLGVSSNEQKQMMRHGASNFAAPMGAVEGMGSIQSCKGQWVKVKMPGLDGSPMVGWLAPGSHCGNPVTTCA